MDRASEEPQTNMKVLLKYRSNKRIVEEVVDLIQGEAKAFGTTISAPENHTMFEDYEGLFSLPNEDIIEIRELNNIPKPSEN